MHSVRAETLHETHAFVNLMHRASSSEPFQEDCCRGHDVISGFGHGYRGWADGNLDLPQSDNVRLFLRAIARSRSSAVSLVESVMFWCALESLCIPL